MPTRKELLARNICPDCDYHVDRCHCDPDELPHKGRYSHIGGTWWCDTCNSPYCDLA